MTGKSRPVANLPLPRTGSPQARKRRSNRISACRTALAAPHRHADILRKAHLDKSVQPDRTIVIGSPRKVLETKPPSVAAAQTAVKTMKKAMPRTRRALGATGTSGFIVGASVACATKSSFLDAKDAKARKGRKGIQEA